MPYASPSAAPLLLGSDEDATSSAGVQALLGKFMGFINSEVAVLYQLARDGRSDQISACGLEAAHLIARPGKGGFVGRAPYLDRAVLEPLDAVHDAGLIAMGPSPLSWAVAAPVSLETGVGGALIAGFETAPSDRARALWAANSYAALIGLWQQAPAALDGLLPPARHDALTGCLTYDALLDELTREVNRSARGGLDLSICFIDLDGFKAINDRHGHLRGNEVLAHVAAIIRGGVRSCDSVGRYGGDEFVAILPQADECRARQLAARLRATIAAANIRSLDDLLTTSVGVAAWTADLSASELLDLADGALLAAKGRRTAVTSVSHGRLGDKCRATRSHARV